MARTLRAAPSPLRIPICFLSGAPRRPSSGCNGPTLTRPSPCSPRPLIRSGVRQIHMGLALAEFLDDFGRALYKVDQSGLAHKRFLPGIGPFGERDAMKAALAILVREKPEVYRDALMKRQPDLLIPNEWHVEFKVLRPFGDNGKQAENWSQNLLHPYPGHVGSLSDCMKLLDTDCNERKAVVVFGFEHDPPQIALDPCIKGFEILAKRLFGFVLSERMEIRFPGLLQPVHQVLRVFAWGVLGRGKGEQQDQPDK
jgi:hypothetical protein